MSVRERILTIRLMEKTNANPAYAKAFGITAISHSVHPGKPAALNSEKHTS